MSETAQDKATSAAKLKIIEDACERSYQDCAPHKAHLDELYEYVMPYRAPTGSNAARQKSRMDRVFDSTATKAAFRFAGRMQQDVTPAFQRFFELKIGPYLQASADQKKQINEVLADVSIKIAAAIEGANFATASHEMYLDLFGGTGALLMLEHERDIVRFVAVPVGEIALREDGAGKVDGVYWKKSYKARTLPGMWPVGKMRISAELRELIEKKPEENVPVVQACEWNETTGEWHFCVFRPGKNNEDAAPIFETWEKTSPWLTPRFYKVPGEAMGRGPGLMGLPTAKTLNKVTELTIKAAAFAILGLWMYRNDRVFNPKTAVMKPGAMWAVGATGGSMGASIQRLDVPARFDISNIILQDLREQVKQVMLDDTLPADSGAVRSATEITERMKRLSADLGGAYARMVLEIIIPLVQRLIDLLWRRKLIQMPIAIDQLISKVEVVSPIAKLNQAQDVSSIVEWLQIMTSLGGQEATMLAAKVEDVFTEIGRKLGISEKLMRSDAEKAQIQKQIAAMLAAKQGQGQAAPQAA